MSASHPTDVRRLVRRTDEKMLGGVCAGLADYLGVDVTVVRLATVVATVLGAGSLVVAYLAAWLLMPEA
jgi:phage shock protein PspC (stress-responsive transcriptional regulator)